MIHNAITEADLQAVATFKGSSRELVAKVRELWSPHAAVVEETRTVHGRPCVVVRLVTIGESDNEAIVSALNRSLFQCFWSMSSVGGLHEYEVPAHQYDEPNWDFALPVSPEGEPLSAAVRAALWDCGVPFTDETDPTGLGRRLWSAVMDAVTGYGDVQASFETRLAPGCARTDGAVDVPCSTYLTVGSCEHVRRETRAVAYGPWRVDETAA